jgi:N-acyl-D-glutamate deacylase
MTLLYRSLLLIGAVVLLCAPPFSASQAGAQTYDLVIANGRVMDPDSGLDAIRHVGIKGGAIRAISETPLEGRDTVDATGCVVAPGFIDLNTYDHGDPFFRLRAADGVTAVLNLEQGATNIPA